LYTGLAGSPGYIAPEIFTEQFYSSKIDIFSIGVVLYALISGTMPFTSTSMQKTVRRNMAAKPVFSERRFGHVDLSIQHFIKQLLDPNPDRRPTAE
jgi:serine/threonine protein kinase